MRLIVVFFLFLGVLIGPYSFASAKNEGIGLQIEPLEWEKVDQILPRYSKFTVLDVETGLHFDVQRRAGSSHADVQPITAKDTEIMKEIYGGKWSWKRRAIIVIHGDQWIAASMNGMPHGAGTLDNNFRGHFCIHFNGSKTHRKKTMDDAHKLMVLKAAGELEAYLANADPITIVTAFIAGIKQQDPLITSMISLQTMDWKKHFQAVENIKLRQIPTIIQNNENEIILEVPVEIEWIDSHSEKTIFAGEMYLVRTSLTDMWKIDSVRFLEESGIS